MNAHDLLRVSAGAASFADAPGWVRGALDRAPYVVVRRAAMKEGHVPVGIRGATRGERFGTWLDLASIDARSTPEQLAAAPVHAARAALPALSLLVAIKVRCDHTQLAWGPTGSVGFELASGVPTVTESSDLDLVMRAPAPLDRAWARAWLSVLTRSAAEHATRIDVQIETPCGAFSLAEFAHPGARVMLRSPDGPLLVDDPWHRCIA